MIDRRRHACWPRNNFAKAPMDAIGAWVLVTATILLSLVFLAEVVIVPAVS